MDLPPITPTLHATTANPRPDLRRSAQALETAFLAEMLKAAGTVQTPDGFDGGPGEAQFATFLADAQARALVAAGGLGLTSAIEAALSRQAHPGGSA
jgi:peptidoglycan hydrolase FlgJ